MRPRGGIIGAAVALPSSGVWALHEYAPHKRGGIIGKPTTATVAISQGILSLRELETYNRAILSSSNDATLSNWVVASREFNYSWRN
jgi:hypothetical protein